MAIGAGAADITRLLIGEVAALFALGALGGIALLLVASRVSGSILTGVVPVAGPGLLVFTLLIVALAAATALIIPLRRATSIDPLAALRAD